MSAIPTLLFRWLKSPSGQGILLGDGDRLRLQQYHESIDPMDGVITGEWQDVPLVEP